MNVLPFFGEALNLMEMRDKIQVLHDQVQSLHKASLREKIAVGVQALRAAKDCDGVGLMAGLDADLAAFERCKL